MFCTYKWNVGNRKTGGRQAPAAMLLSGVVTLGAASGCGGAPSPSAGDVPPEKVGQTSQALSSPWLSQIGTGDLGIQFNVTTTQGGVVGLFGQRNVCGYGVFWDVRLVNGHVTVETDDFRGKTGYSSLQSTGIVNDGNPYNVQILRTNEVLTISIVNTNTNTTVSTDTGTSIADFGGLPALGQGIYGCVGKDGTQALSSSSLLNIVLISDCTANDVCSQTTPGEVISSPEFYVVFWGLNSSNDSANNEIPNITNLLTAFTLGNQGATLELPGTGWRWFRTSTQYTGIDGPSGSFSVGAGSSPAFFPSTNVWMDTSNSPPPDTTAAVSSWDGQYIRPEVLRARSHFGIGANDANAIVIVATGPRNNLPGGHCARHDAVTADASGNALPVALPYVDFLYQPSVLKSFVCYTEAANNVTAHSNLALGHELAEALTDPRFSASDGATYLDNSNNEVGDKCGQEPSIVTATLLPQQYTPNTFAITPLWSNAMADRFSSPPGNTSLNGCAYSRSNHAAAFALALDSSLWWETLTADAVVGGSSTESTVSVQNMWSPWTAAPAGTSLTLTPAAASRGPSSVDVFIADANDPRAMHHTTSNDLGTTVTWETLPEAPAGWTLNQKPPSAASWARENIQVFTVDALGRVVRNHFDVSASTGTGAWSGWATVNLPTRVTATSNVAVASWAASLTARFPQSLQTMMAAFVGSDNHLYLGSSVDYGTFSWNGVNLSSVPGKPSFVRVALAAMGPGRLAVVLLDSQGNMWQWISADGETLQLSFGSSPNQLGELASPGAPFRTTGVPGAVAAVGLGDGRFMFGGVVPASQGYGPVAAMVDNDQTISANWLGTGGFLNSGFGLTSW